MSPDAYTKSYIIPIGDLNLMDRQGMRENCDVVLLSQAHRLAIRDNDADLVIRDASPAVDVGLAATDDWLIAGPGIAGTPLQYFAPALAQDRVLGFWGCAINSPTPSLSILRFTLGAASATSRAFFQLEQLESRLEPAGYFSQVISYVRNDVARVMVTPKLAFGANGQRLVMFARMLEPVDVTVGRQPAI